MEKEILSVDQAQHLQELGLDMTDAAVWFVRLSPANEWKPTLKRENCLKLFQNPTYRSCYCPTYTFQEIWDKLPETILEGGYCYELVLNKVNSEVSYNEQGGDGNLQFFTGESPIHSAYQMLRWAIQAGHLKENKEQEDDMEKKTRQSIFADPKTGVPYPNPMMNLLYYDIVRTAALRIIGWFAKEGCYTYKVGISNEKSAKAVRQLLLKEPEPLIDYLYGLSRLKRIQINGKGTKKEPYTAVWCTDYLRFT